MFKMIPLALDEPEKARRTVDITADLAKRYDPEVVVEHIWEDGLMTARSPPVQRHPAPAFPRLSGTSWSRSRGALERGQLGTERPIATPRSRDWARATGVERPTSHAARGRQ